MLNRDARNNQIILLTTFLLLGIVAKDWTIKPDLVIVLWVSTLGTQVICSWIFKADKINWRSAIITSLSLVLLLRANSYLSMAIAGCLGISSKFLGVDCVQDSNVDLFENVENRVKRGLNKSNIYSWIK